MVKVRAEVLDGLSWGLSNEIRADSRCIIARTSTKDSSFDTLASLKSTIWHELKV